MTQEVNDDLKIQLINSTSNNKFLEDKILVLKKELENKKESKPFTGVSVLIKTIFLNFNH